MEPNTERHIGYCAFDKTCRRSSEQCERLRRFLSTRLEGFAAMLLFLMQVVAVGRLTVQQAHRDGQQRPMTSIEKLRRRLFVLGEVDNEFIWGWCSN